ncbi:MAG: hypothetical protein E6J91_13555 [Deltaproteobacteria bacterium]|nr:MAG: hypothetical protein E6J91_13555 [Deltaproteobacteria bacterium]
MGRRVRIARLAAHGHVARPLGDQPAHVADERRGEHAAGQRADRGVGGERLIEPDPHRARSSRRSGPAPGQRRIACLGEWIDGWIHGDEEGADPQGASDGVGFTPGIGLM